MNFNLIKTKIASKLYKKRIIIIEHQHSTLMHFISQIKNIHIQYRYRTHLIYMHGWIATLSINICINDTHTTLYLSLCYIIMLMIYIY